MKQIQQPKQLKQPKQDWLDTGAQVGRQQAFAVIANKCSAAQALLLKQLKAAAPHEPLGLTWEEFCTRHVGLSCRHVDRLIAQYNEFGEAYFRISSLARITPDDYRALAPHVTGDCIEIDGEDVAIIPENAARIRAFLRARRAVPDPSPDPYPPYLGDLTLRHHALISDVKRQLKPGVPENTRTSLKGVADLAIQDWKAILHRAVELAPR